MQGSKKGTLEQNESIRNPRNELRCDLLSAFDDGHQFHQYQQNKQLSFTSNHWTHKTTMLHGLVHFNF